MNLLLLVHLLIPFVLSAKWWEPEPSAGVSERKMLLQMFKSGLFTNTPIVMFPRLPNENDQRYRERMANIEADHINLDERTLTSLTGLNFYKGMIDYAGVIQIDQNARSPFDSLKLNALIDKFKSTSFVNYYVAMELIGEAFEYQVNDPDHPENQRHFDDTFINQIIDIRSEEFNLMVNTEGWAITYEQAVEKFIKLFKVFTSADGRVNQKNKRFKTAKANLGNSVRWNTKDKRLAGFLGFFKDKGNPLTADSMDRLLNSFQTDTERENFKAIIIQLSTQVFNAPGFEQTGDVLNGYQQLVEDTDHYNHGKLLYIFRNKFLHCARSRRRSLSKRSCGTPPMPNTELNPVRNKVKVRVNTKPCKGTTCSRTNAISLTASQIAALTRLKSLLPNIKTQSGEPSGKFIGEDIYPDAGDGVSSVAAAFQMIMDDVDDLPADVIAGPGKEALNNFSNMLEQDIANAQVSEKNFGLMDSIVNVQNRLALKLKRIPKQLKNFKLVGDRKLLLMKALQDLKRQTNSKDIFPEGKTPNANDPSSLWEGAKNEGDVIDGVMNMVSEFVENDSQPGTELDLSGIRDFIVFERASLSVNREMNEQVAVVNSDVSIQSFNDISEDSLTFSSDVASTSHQISSMLVRSLKLLAKVTGDKSILGGPSDPVQDADGNIRPSDLIVGATSLGDVFGKIEQFIMNAPKQDPKNLLRLKSVKQLGHKILNAVRAAVQKKLDNQEKLSPDDVQLHDSVSGYVDRLTQRSPDFSSVKDKEVAETSEYGLQSPLVDGSSANGNSMDNQAGSAESFNKPTISESNIDRTRKASLSLRKKAVKINRNSVSGKSTRNAIGTKS
ncbi:hypothetical protein HDV02_002233 [Globomyces sp. JEL0801]|nr:hypothetical protein HDV02_002233 [Globomyces sp. JEL0801]